MHSPWQQMIKIDSEKSFLKLYLKSCIFPSIFLGEGGAAWLLTIWREYWTVNNGKIHNYHDNSDSDSDSTPDEEEDADDDDGHTDDGDDDRKQDMVGRSWWEKNNILSKYFSFISNIFERFWHVSKTRGARLIRGRQYSFKIFFSFKIFPKDFNIFPKLVGRGW